MLQENKNDGQSSPLFFLQRPAFWSPGLFAFVLGAVVVWLVQVFHTHGPFSPLWTLNRVVFAGSLLFVPLGLAVVYRWFTRPGLCPVIELLPQVVLLPRSAETGSSVAVSYGDILSFERRGGWPQGHIYIGTRQRLFVYPCTAFADGQAIRQLHREIKERVAELEGGALLLQKMAQRSRVSGIAVPRKPWVTWSMLLLLCLVYVAQLVAGAFEGPFGLVLFGANAPALVRDGQLFRLASANFLHGNFLHLYMNGLALLILGGMLERLLGHLRFLLVYLVCALLGSLASAVVAQAAFSVGASTAMFGLLGALAALNLRFRGELPGGFRQSFTWWGFVIGVNAVLPVMVAQIDIAAHVGGFVAGCLVTLFIYRGPQAFDPKRPLGAVVPSCTALLLALFLVSGGMAIRSVVGGDREDELRVATELVNGPLNNPHALSEVAWEFVTLSGASPRHLELARSAAQKAVLLEPENGAYLDGLATAYYRLGYLDQAVSVQRQAIARSPSRFHFTQLSLFLSAREESAGLYMLGNVTPTAVHFYLEPKEQVYGKQRAVLVELDTWFDHGLVVYVRAKHGSKELGMFRASFGTRHQSEYRLVPQQANFFYDWPDEVEFKIALIDTTGSECFDGQWRWRFWFYL